ncbi:MAG: single-stranded-DNA-specific exonuclease RecJ [Candidatus Paceibacterota bacterium]|jgi:single-stranded-DNA-specific exonuclease
MASLTQQLLKARGITTKKAAEIFLHPDYVRDLHDPFLFSGMKKAVAIILHAISNQEQIVIFGDYDCDGIPGTALLYEFFKKIGYKKISAYIPHRYTEGYGMTVEAVRKLQKQHASLIITVDCGITDTEAVDEASKFGIDVIITDHHIVQDKLPKAYAIINAQKKGDKYKNKNICGAGTAFKLVQALMKEGKFELPKGWEKWLLDLAGLATIADMVSLTGENRVLAYYGLKVLRKTPRVGILQLLKKKNVRPENLTEDDVGFTIGPHINAASRMGDPYDAFKLLTTEDGGEAAELVQKLLDHNADRKSEVQIIIQEAEALMHLHTDLPVIVIGHRDWKPGIVGLAANMLAEKYEKPAFVWGKHTSTHLKGSCRSDGSVNIVELMTETKEISNEIFLDFGGHELAGGFSIYEDKIELFAPALISAYKKLNLESSTLYNKAQIEKSEYIEIDVNDITWEMYREVDQFAPFGVGNEKPVFSLKNVEVSEVRFFGKEGIHTELILKKSRSSIGAIKFFTYDEFKNIKLDTKLDLQVTLEKSTFKYPHELRLRIVDWAYAQGGLVE